MKDKLNKTENILSVTIITSIAYPLANPFTAGYTAAARCIIVVVVGCIIVVVIGCVVAAVTRCTVTVVMGCVVESLATHSFIVIHFFFNFSLC